MRLKIYLGISRLVAVCLLTLCGLAPGQDKPTHSPTPKSTRVDKEGNPLPPGAVARFGFMPLRHGEVTDFIFESNGRTLLSVGMDGYLRQFNLNSGKQIGCTRLNAEYGSFTRLTLSVDGKIVLAEKRTGNLASKGRFCLFDATTGGLIKSLETSATWMVHRELSLDTRHISTATWVRDSNKVYARTLLMDCESGQEREMLISRPDGSERISYGGTFAPNGLWYAVAGDQNQALQVVEYRTGKRVCLLGKQINSTSSFSHNSKLLVTVSLLEDEADHKPHIRIFRIPSGEQVNQFPIEVGFSEVAFSHDGKVLARSTFKEIQIIDLASQKVRKRWPGSVSKLRFSHNDKILGGLYENSQAVSTNSESAKLHLWNVDSGQEIHAREAEFNRLIATSSNEELIATLNKRVDSIAVWNLPKQKRTIQIPLEEDQRLANQLKFAQNDGTLYATFHSTPPWKWDVATGKNLGAIVSSNPIELKEGTGIDDVLTDDATFVAIARQKAGNPFVSEVQLNQLLVWDAETGKQLYARTIADSLSSAKWMPGNKTVLLRGRDSFTIIDAASGEVRSKIQSPASFDLLPSPRGWLLASRRIILNPNASLSIYEAATGHELVQLPVGLPNSRDEVCWIDDQHLLVINSLTAKVWDVLTGKMRLDLSAEYEGNGIKESVRVIQALCLPKKKQLFTVQVDRTGLLWDLAPALKTVIEARVDIEKAEADELWRELGSVDPKKAYKATWRFVQSPASLKFLAHHLLEGKDSEYEKAQALISKLDANQFQTRETAQRELQAMGSAAWQAIRDAQGKQPSPEAKRRLDTLSSPWPAEQLPPTVLQRIRAIHVLESLNSVSSRQLLQKMIAKGLNKIERDEAEAAIVRMK